MTMSMCIIYVPQFSRTYCWVIMALINWNSKKLLLDWFSEMASLKSDYDIYSGGYPQIVSCEGMPKLHIVGSGDRVSIWLVVSLRGSSISYGSSFVDNVGHWRENSNPSTSNTRKMTIYGFIGHEQSFVVLLFNDFLF